MSRDRRAPEQVENALRDSLRVHAAQAPDADELTIRILAAAERPAEPVAPPDPRRRRWQTWGMPLVAAASVAAVVIGALAIEQYHPGSDHGPAADSTLPAQHTASPMPHRTTAAPTAHPSTPESSHSAPAVTNPVGLNDFQAIDTTFVGTDYGWALGTADCLDGSGGTCAAMIRTTDGGRSWHSVKQPTGNVAADCNAAKNCVSNIRFASPDVGYAYSASDFEMTTDGGLSWMSEPGGAEALETLDGNVIRLVDDHGGCPGPCNLRAETADVGSASWSTVALSSKPVDAVSVTLVRSGSEAVALVSLEAHAGAVPIADIYTSTDDGNSWNTLTDPCKAAAGAGFGADQAIAADDGSISLLCAGGGAYIQRQLVVTAAHLGARFHAGPLLHFAPASDYVSLGALSNTTLFAGTDAALRRSTDGGRTWHVVLRLHTSYTGTGPGFEDSSTGRWVTNDGQVIWTTHDAGATWTAVTL